MTKIQASASFDKVRDIESYKDAQNIIQGVLVDLALEMEKHVDSKITFGGLNRYSQKDESASFLVSANIFTDKELEVLAERYREEGIAKYKEEMRKQEEMRKALEKADKELNNG